jgi:sterol desaturase/sphingolipid hydroxylase (fatty acid hydroxylase superfamily)
MIGVVVGATVALAVLGIVYCTLERLWPAIPGQRRLRGGVRTDLTYYYLNATVTKLLTGIIAVLIVLAAAHVFGLPVSLDQIKGAAHRQTFVTRLPWWAQLALLVLLSDLLGYWTHRLFHRQPVLWRYHVIHHSSRRLDWLSGARVHPLNDALQNAIPAVPLLLLGFSPASLPALFAILGAAAVIVHANVGWTWGPFRYVVISPVFHRWHHTTERCAMNKNFAGLFPWMDLLFGTFYMPKGVQPMEFGVDDSAVPTSVLAQLAYPLRRDRRGT